MSTIPGLTHLESLKEEDNIMCVSFDLKSFSIPETHRYGKCRPVTEFDKICYVGEGAFGSVYKAKDKVSEQIVALKKLKMGKESECMPQNYTREIIILKGLKHINIINLHGIAAGKSLESTYLILEYCEYTLAKFIDEVEGALLQHPQIKCIMHQLFIGLEYLQKEYVIHRDLNVANILFTDVGILKIADFGSCRKISLGDMTPNVTSRWYRAPELLLGSKNYSYTVDTWSAGCILAELLSRKPLFPGNSDSDMIQLIIDCLGTPTESIWPGFSQLPVLENYDLRLQPYNKLRSFFGDHPGTCVALLHKLFLYNPKTRYTAGECLQHPYFVDRPSACLPEALALVLKTCVK